jgi:hypothetical protein
MIVYFWQLFSFKNLGCEFFTNFMVEIAGIDVRKYNLIFTLLFY